MTFNLERQNPVKGKVILIIKSIVQAIFGAHLEEWRKLPIHTLL